MDIDPFSVELAKVTLMLAKELENREPANILCADALFTEWPKVDAIIGNPPFPGRCHSVIAGLMEKTLHSARPRMVG